MSEQLMIAAVQIDVALADKPLNLARIEDRLREAGRLRLSSLALRLYNSSSGDRRKREGPS